MIRMIKGTYGPDLITPDYGPFDAGADEERLVSKGVAEYVESAEEVNEAPKNTKGKKSSKKNDEPVISAADPE